MRAIAVLILAVAARSNAGATVQDNPRLHVVVNPADAVVAVGDSLRLRAEVRDSSGRPVAGARVQWVIPVSSMEGSVDSTGLVRAGAPGTMVVFAVPAGPDGRPGTPASVRIRMMPAAAARVVIEPVVRRLVVGQQYTLGATAFSAAGDRRDDMVTWSSGPRDIATITADGRVTALRPGRATIVASTPGARSSLTVEVVPNAIRQVAISGGMAEARTGDVLRFRASATDANGRVIAGLTPAWAMAPGSGLIDQDGAFVADAPGTYTITAGFGVASAQTVVRVRARDVRRQTTTVARVPVSKLLTAEFWPHPNGTNAYLSTIGDRVYALDISDPAAPRVTDSVVVDARHINDVMATADGKVAVMTRENASSRRNGIVILSLADPAHPRVLSEYTETVTGGVHSSFVATVAGHGTFVFLTDDATGSMRVIDINDPTKPAEVARWETTRAAGRYLHDIDVQDGLAYLSYWNDGLVILDVGNGMKGGSPRAPKLVSQFRYDLESLYRDVEAEGGPGYIRGTHTAWRAGRYVFVGDEVFTAKPIGLTMPGMGLGKANGRLHVIDVSNIERPREVAWYEPKDGGVHNVWVTGDTLYLGDYQGGLRVLDISGELRGDLLAQGREMAHVHTGDSSGVLPNAAMAWGAFYHKGFIWVNDVFSGLWIIRLEPKRPLTVP